MNILLKNCLSYLILQTERRDKNVINDVVEGLEELIKLKQIKINEDVEVCLNNTKYFKLDYFLHNYNMGFYANYKLTKLLIDNNCYDNLSKHDFLMLTLNIVSEKNNMDMLSLFLSTIPKEKLLDFLEIKKNEDNSNREKIYFHCFYNPSYLSTLKEQLPYNFLVKNYASFDFFNLQKTSLKLDIKKLYEIESILNGFFTCKNKKGKYFYEQIINDSPENTLAMCKNLPSFLYGQEKNIEKIIIEHIKNKKNHNRKFELSLFLENWYSVTNEGEDLLTILVRDPYFNFKNKDALQLISLISNDELLKNYVINREKNLLLELAKYCVFDKEIITKTLSVLPELKNKSSKGEQVLDVVFNDLSEKSLISKKIFFLKNISDELILGKEPESVIHFFVSEVENEYLCTDFHKMLIEIIKKMNNINKKVKIIDQELLENLSFWRKNKIALHRCKEATDIIDSIINSGLPVDIIKRFKSMERIMSNEKTLKITNIALEKVMLLEENKTKKYNNVPLSKKRI